MYRKQQKNITLHICNVTASDKPSYYCCYIIMSDKTQKIVCKNTIVGYHPVSTHTCLCKQKVGKPSQNTAQLCAKAEGCVHENLRADKLWKGWEFLVIDLLTGRAGELIETLVNREVDVACIQEAEWKVVAAGSLELKAKDISCSGWEVRRNLTV